MFDVLKSEQEKAVDFIEKNYENNSFSHAYIVEVKNYNNLELFLNYFVSKLLDEDNIDINNNGDIYIIKPDNGTIKKNQIDELQKNFFTKSVISKRKVYIMYGADKMNDISANSLLKFIEEPENNIFAILITENRFALLKTILSRCQVLRLKSNNLDRNNDDVLNIIYYASNSARPLDESSYDYVKSIMEKMHVSMERAKELVRSTDRYRSQYYKYYSGGLDWTEPLNYDVVKDTIIVAIGKNIIERAGAWYSYKDKFKVQGIPKVVEEIKSNPELMDMIYGEVMNLVKKE